MSVFRFGSGRIRIHVLVISMRTYYHYSTFDPQISLLRRKRLIKYLFLSQLFRLGFTFDRYPFTTE